MSDTFSRPISTETRVLKDAKCDADLPYLAVFRTLEIPSLEASAPESEDPASLQASVTAEEKTPIALSKEGNPEHIEATGIHTLHSHTYKHLYEKTSKTDEERDGGPSQEDEDLERDLKQDVADEIENLRLGKLRVYEPVPVEPAKEEVALEEPLRVTKPKVPRRIGSARLKGVPKQNRLVWQIEALRDLVLGSKLAVYEVSTILGSNVQQDILRIATGAHGRPKPLDRLRRQLKKDFAALGLPYDYIMTISEKDNQLTLRMLTIASKRRTLLSAFRQRMVDVLGDAIDHPVRIASPPMGSNFISMPPEEGYFFEGPYITMSDSVSRLATKNYKAEMMA